MKRPADNRLRGAVAALLADLALALAACSDAEDSLDPGSAVEAPDYSAALDSAPPELAALYDGGEGGLVDAGADALEAELERLRGTLS